MPGFFDKVKEGIDKGVSTASAKSKELIETQQVKAKIGELEDQKRAALEDLGSLVYRMVQNDSFEPDPIKSKAEAITALGAQIAEKEEDLRQIRVRSEASPAGKPVGLVVCECGTTLAEGAKFCPNCGKKTF
jgi:hypothetical protein